MSGKKQLVVRTSKELAAYLSSPEEKYVRKGLDALASQIRKTRHYYRTGSKDDVNIAAVTEDVLQQYLASSPECSELFPFITSTDPIYCNFDTIGSISEILAFCLDPSFRVHRPTHSIKTAQRQFKEGERFLVHCVSSENLVNVHSGLRLCLALCKHSSSIAAEFCRVFPFKLQFFTNIAIKPICPISTRERLIKNEENARKLMPPKDSLRDFDPKTKETQAFYQRLNRGIFVEMFVALLQWKDMYIIKELVKDPTYFLMRPITHIFYDSMESSKMYFKTLLTDFVQNPHVTTKMLAHCFNVTVLEEIFMAAAVSLIHKKHIQHFIKCLLLRLLDVHDEDMFDGDNGDLDNVFGDVATSTTAEKGSSRENLLFRITSRLRPHEELGHLKLLSVVFTHSPQLLPKFMRQMTHHYDARTNYRQLTRHGMLCKLLRLLKANSGEQTVVELALPSTYYKQVIQTSFSRSMPIVHVIVANTISNLLNTYSYPVWGNAEKTTYSVQLFHKVQIKRTIPEIDVIGKHFATKDATLETDELTMLHVLHALMLLNACAPELLYQGMFSVNRLMTAKMRGYSYALQEAFFRMCILQGLDGKVKLSSLVLPPTGKYSEHLEQVCDNTHLIGPISVFGNALHLCLQTPGKDINPKGDLTHAMYCSTRRNKPEDVEIVKNMNLFVKQTLALLLSYGTEYQLDATTSEDVLIAYNKQLNQDCTTLLQYMTSDNCDFVEIVLLYSVSYGKSKYHFFYAESGLSEDLAGLQLTPIMLSLLMVAKDVVKGRKRGHIALFIASVLRQAVFLSDKRVQQMEFFKQLFAKDNVMGFGTSWMAKDASMCSFLRAIGVFCGNSEDILEVFAPKANTKEMKEDEEEEEEDADIREDAEELVETLQNLTMCANITAASMLSAENIFKWNTLKAVAQQYKDQAEVHPAVDSFLMNLPMALVGIWKKDLKSVWDAYLYKKTQASIGSNADAVHYLFDRDSCMFAMLRFLHVKLPELYNDVTVYTTNEPDHAVFRVLNNIVDLVPADIKDTRNKYVLYTVSEFLRNIERKKLPLHHQRGLHVVEVKMRVLAHDLFVQLISNNTVMDTEVTQLVQFLKVYLDTEQVTTVVKDMLTNNTLRTENLYLFELVDEKIDYTAISEIQDGTLILAAKHDKLNFLTNILPRVNTELLSTATKELLTSLFERVTDTTVLGFICQLLQDSHRKELVENMQTKEMLTEEQFNRALVLLSFSTEEHVLDAFIPLLKLIVKAISKHFETSLDFKDAACITLLQTLHGKMHSNAAYNAALRVIVLDMHYSMVKKTYEVQQRDFCLILHLLMSINGSNQALFCLYIMQTMVTISYVLKDGMEYFDNILPMLQVAKKLYTMNVAFVDVLDLAVLYLDSKKASQVKTWAENMKIKDDVIDSGKVDADVLHSCIANALLKRVNVTVMRGVQLNAPKEVLPLLLDFVTGCVVAFSIRDRVDEEEKEALAKNIEVESNLDECLLANLADLFTFAVSSEHLYTSLAPFIDLIETSEASLDVRVAKFIKRKADWVESNVQFETRQALLAMQLHILSKFNSKMVKNVEFELFATLGRLAFSTYYGTNGVLDILRKGICQQLHRCYGIVFNNIENEIVGTVEPLVLYPHIRIYSIFPHTYTNSGALWGTIGENELVSWYILSSEKSLRHLEVLRNIDGLLQTRTTDTWMYNFKVEVMARGPPSLEKQNCVIMDTQSKHTWYDPGFVLPYILDYVNNQEEFNWMNCVKSGYVSFCVQCLDQDYSNYHGMVKHILMRVTAYLLHMERRRRFIYEKKKAQSNRAEDEQYLLDEELEIEEVDAAKRDVEDAYWNMVFDDTTMEMTHAFKKTLPAALNQADQKEFLASWTPSMKLLTYILLKLKQSHSEEEGKVVARSVLAFVAKCIMSLVDTKESCVFLLPFLITARFNDKVPFLWKHAKRVGFGLYMSILGMVEKAADMEKVYFILNEFLQFIQLDSRHLMVGLDLLTKVARLVQDKAKKQSVVVHLCQLVQELNDRRFGYGKIESEKEALVKCLQVYMEHCDSVTKKMVLGVVPEAGKLDMQKKKRMIDVLHDEHDTNVTTDNKSSKKRKQ